MNTTAGRPEPESVFIGVQLWFHARMTSKFDPCLALLALCGLLAGCEVNATGPNGAASVDLQPTNGPDVEVSSRSDHTQIDFDTKGSL